MDDDDDALALVGDELRLDGETVATLVPGLRPSLEIQLIQRFGRRPSNGGYREDMAAVHGRNDALAAEMRAAAEARRRC